MKFLAQFIRKAAEQRLPAQMPLDKPPTLKPVNPTNGWLVQRWPLDRRRRIPPTLFTQNSGNLHEAFWTFHKAMAWAKQNRN